MFNYVDFGVFPKGEPTFANHFKAQGYATAVAGKWQLLTAQNGISPAEAGFDRHCVWNIPGTERSRYWKPSLMHDGKVINHGEDDYGSTIIADYLIDFIKTNKDKPAHCPKPIVEQQFRSLTSIPTRLPFCSVGFSEMEFDCAGTAASRNQGVK